MCESFERFVATDVGDASLSISFYKRHGVVANLIELCHNTFCLRDAKDNRLLPIPKAFREIGEVNVTD